MEAVDKPRAFDDFVVLIARQRSGTNPLRSVLDAHADIFSVPEIFNNRPTPDWELEVEANYFNFVAKRLDGRTAEALAVEDHHELFIDYLEYLRCFSDKRFLLVDVKYNSTHHLDGAWKFITEEPAIFGYIREHRLRVINLTRRNFLRYYLSEVKAQHTRRWEAFDPAVVGDRPWFQRKYAARDAPKDEPVRLDVGELVRTLALCKAENEAVARAFDGYDLVLELEYENLFDHIGAPLRKDVVERIATWLDIPNAFVERRPQYKKQSDLPLAKTIRNFAAVKRALEGTEFEYCLEDEALYRGRAAA